MNKSALSIMLFLALLAFSTAQAQLPAKPRKPPVGVPSDATLFNGKWYRTYIEKATWKRAQERCRTLGGQLACVPDAPTQAFLPQIHKAVDLWIGATDEKVEGVWIWADGTEMKYKAWASNHPVGGSKKNYLALGWGGNAWFNAADSYPCQGFICEWKDK